MNRLQSLDQDNYLSRKAISDIEKSIERLEKSRPQAVKDLSSAREMGDLSENAAYSEAKARLSGLDTRIMALREQLRNAVVVPKGAGADGAVRIGATVRVKVSGKEKVYEITGSNESSPADGRISHVSPLGKALLGKRAGDKVLFETPAKAVTYEVVSVE